MIDLRAIKSVAVVGASNNPQKTGFRIVENLIARKYQVYPINLKETQIWGLQAYPSLSALPLKPDLVDIVVPPATALKIAQEAVNLKIPNVWVQPGAESEELDLLIKDHPETNFVTHSCIMVN